jgi:hypothetical protein
MWKRFRGRRGFFQVQLSRSEGQQGKSDRRHVQWLLFLAIAGESLLREDFILPGIPFPAI